MLNKPGGEARDTVCKGKDSPARGEDDLTILDLESIVLNGQIVERQHDRKTNETKYLINGRTLEGCEAETVLKIGFTGALIFITVYVA